MGFTEEKQNYYELLEIGPDATPQEIRTAYLRTKAAYKKDSPALYTLIDESETEALLQKLEEAYQILSHPDRRREYDRSHGFIGIDMDDSQPAPEDRAKIVSIDRVPPMEDSRGNADPLVAPVTDFMGAPPPRPMASAMDDPFSRERHQSAPAERRSIAPPSAPAPLEPPSSQSLSGSIAEEIARETEWKGITLRRVREARGVSIEELSEYTKISKTYLMALEEESFSKLPAPVFLRGFVIQVAKFLKLPHDKVATAYMSRRAAQDGNKR